MGNIALKSGINEKTKKNGLIILGCRGHGKVVADIASGMNTWDKIAFLDDDINIKPEAGIEIYGKLDQVFKYIDNYDIFIAIGSNKTREVLQKQLIQAGASIPVLIHPTSIIGSNVQIGVGTVLMAGAIVNCWSKIGMGCIINTAATIDHDCIIEDYVHISPGAHLAGTVKIGHGSWLGIGSIVINNIEIVSETKVGAGSVIIRSIIEPGTYFGSPAIKKIEGE